MDSKHSSSGIGILGIIEVVFVVLKVLGVAPVANWAWSVVLIPLWIDLGIIAIALIVMGFIVLYNTNKKY